MIVQVQQRKAEDGAHMPRGIQIRVVKGEAQPWVVWLPGHFERQAEAGFMLSNSIFVSSSENSALYTLIWEIHRTSEILFNHHTTQPWDQEVVNDTILFRWKRRLGPGSMESCTRTHSREWVIWQSNPEQQLSNLAFIYQAIELQFCLGGNVFSSTWSFFCILWGLDKT